MVAITWLSLGVVYAVYSVLSHRNENRSLLVLGQTAAEAEIVYLRQGASGLPDLVDRTSKAHQIQWCAITDAKNQIIAHTDPGKVGLEQEPPIGEQLRWGAVTATKSQTADAQTVLNMHVPLEVQGETFGTLWMATPGPDFWSTAKAAAEVAPPAILVPLAMIAAGAFVIRRMTGPLEQVDRQLREASVSNTGTLPPLTKLPASCSISVGWNRIVDALQHQQPDHPKQSIAERVANAIQGRKQRDSLQVLDHMVEGFAYTDAEGSIQFANRALDALLGTTSSTDSPTGCPIRDYLAGHIDNVDELGKLLDVSPERSARAEFTRTSGQRQRVLRVERQPVKEGSDGHLWSIRDVTQQKLAEEMRGQFIDSATHELRTPLANIKAYSETLALMEDVDIEQQKEFCNTINSEATRLARFVDDLLSVSSMEVGSLSINRQNVHLERLFEEVVEKVRPLTSSKSQELGVDLPEKLGEAHLDKDKVATMLVNLLGNASKYTPEGGRVGLIVNKADNHLTVSVEDTGVGIPTSELPHVFEKFFRSKDPRVQKETGTGLGLALANEIVRLHGGEITVKSAVDVGSTFTVSLPLYQEARL
ncbi:Sensor histidine kinase YycG [Aeoliella mucimassa]|uniref:histidine kinase n=2 Tax=Aeoliella mucimassa TaxID=2527972 RepID=A0A518AJ96_9BACT|nr:Sensor histidine kinase YycG [Aeoliella mucimassa]